MFWQSHFKLYFYHLKLRVLVSSIKNSTLCSPQCYCKLPKCCFHCPASSFLLNQKQNSFYSTFLHWNRLRLSMTSRFEFLFLWFPRISTFTCVYKLIWSSAYWLVKHSSASPLKWNLGIILPLIQDLWIIFPKCFCHLLTLWLTGSLLNLYVPHFLTNTMGT